MWIWVLSQSSFQLWWPIVVHIRKRKDMGPQSLYCYGIITDNESMSYEMKNGINKWNIMTHINTKLFAWVKSVISISGPFWPCTILNALQVVVPRFRNQWTCHSVNKNHKNSVRSLIPAWFYVNPWRGITCDRNIFLGIHW